ncbi:Putative membrane protein YeiH [Cronobacter malonaticus 681]|nr:Putative membrane protein YeiH [Cronobacter malonaticus 681]
MTTLTYSERHHGLMHFLPGLALTGLLTAAAIWVGAIPAVGSGSAG